MIDGKAWKIGFNLVLTCTVQHLITVWCKLSPNVRPAQDRKYFHTLVAALELKNTWEMFSSCGTKQHQHFEGIKYPILLKASSRGNLAFHNFHMKNDILKGKTLTHMLLYTLLGSHLFLKNSQADFTVNLPRVSNVQNGLSSSSCTTGGGICSIICTANSSGRIVFSLSSSHTPS